MKRSLKCIAAAAALGVVISVFVLAGCSTSAQTTEPQRRDLAALKAEQAA